MKLAAVMDRARASLVWVLLVVAPVSARAGIDKGVLREALACQEETGSIVAEKGDLRDSFSGTTCENWAAPGEDKLNTYSIRGTQLMKRLQNGSAAPGAEREIKAIACNQLLPLAKDLLARYQAKRSSCHSLPSRGRPTGGRPAPDCSNKCVAFGFSSPGQTGPCIEWKTVCN
jgi:hypothetical protein